jgi:hypothetical protein
MGHWGSYSTASFVLCSIHGGIRAPWVRQLYEEDPDRMTDGDPSPPRPTQARAAGGRP